MKMIIIFMSKNDLSYENDNHFYSLKIFNLINMIGFLSYFFYSLCNIFVQKYLYLIFLKSIYLYIAKITLDE